MASSIGSKVDHDAVYGPLVNTDPSDMGNRDRTSLPYPPQGWPAQAGDLPGETLVRVQLESPFGDVGFGGVLLPPEFTYADARTALSAQLGCDTTAVDLLLEDRTPVAHSQEGMVRTTAAETGVLRLRTRPRRFWRQAPVASLFSYCPMEFRNSKPRTQAAVMTLFGCACVLSVLALVGLIAAAAPLVHGGGGRTAGSHGQSGPSIGNDPTRVHDPAEHGGRVFSDCVRLKVHVPDATSGIYSIRPQGSAGPFHAYCDMEMDGGGWTLLMNLDTSDGHVMWWGNELWTNDQSYGSLDGSAHPLVGDKKCEAWNHLDAGELMVMIHRDGWVVGHSIYQKTAPGTLYQIFSRGEQTVLGDRVKGSADDRLWPSENLTKGGRLYANSWETVTIPQSGEQVADNAFILADRIASDSSRQISMPQQNQYCATRTNCRNNRYYNQNSGVSYGGGLGNWHGVGYCCSDRTVAGLPCGHGGAFRTASEAQAGWAILDGYRNGNWPWGTYGTDSHARMTGTMQNAPCQDATWALSNGVQYDFAIFIRA